MNTQQHGFYTISKTLHQQELRREIYLHTLLQLFRLARRALQPFIVTGLGVAEARVAGVVHLDGRVVDAKLSAHLVRLQQRRLRILGLNSEKNSMENVLL